MKELENDRNYFENLLIYYVEKAFCNTLVNIKNVYAFQRYSKNILYYLKKIKDFMNNKVNTKIDQRGKIKLQIKDRFSDLTLRKLIYS